MSPYPCPAEQVTTRNGRTGLTRQCIPSGMMATVPEVTERTGRILLLQDNGSQHKCKKAPIGESGLLWYFRSLRVAGGCPFYLQFSATPPTRAVRAKDAAD